MRENRKCCIREPWPNFESVDESRFAKVFRAGQRERLSDGKPIRWKVRLVLKGFEQVYGRDYTSTTSPTARMESWRILLHIAAVITLSKGRAGPGPTHFSWPLTLALRAGPLSAGPGPGSA